MFSNLAAPVYRLILGSIDRFLIFTPKYHTGIYYYLLIIVLMGLALLVRLIIAPVNAGLQYVTFFPAVTLAAIICGYRAGLLATLIGLVFATYIFTPPYYSISIEVLQTSFWSNIVFLTDGIIISFSIETMHRYRQKYQQELKESKLSEANAMKLNEELEKQIAERKNTELALVEAMHELKKRRVVQHTLPCGGRTRSKAAVSSS